MRFDILTLFPAMFQGPFSESIIRRAIDAGIVEIEIHDIRRWTYDRHRTADDRPYGGGAGMVLMAPPIVEGVESILAGETGKAPILLMSASGVRFNQSIARELATYDRLVLICGHYEGVDQRVVDILDAREVSIGDFVLTGGELPAMVIVDAVARLVPGVIDASSTAEESHETGLLEYPHYTRPAKYRGLEVPDVLLSGHHAMVDAWRRDQAIERTRRRRASERVARDNDEDPSASPSSQGSQD